MRKPIPLGTSDFKEIIDKGCFYIDKTLFIEDLLNNDLTKVALIPRPRRFGKTVNLSMLRYFFEKTSEDTSYLFQNCNIWKKEKYRERQGTFPVIFLSLKEIEGTSWEETFSSFTDLIAEEFERHNYLLEAKILTQREEKIYQSIVSCTANQVTVQKSLWHLSKWLHTYSILSHKTPYNFR